MDYTGFLNIYLIFGLFSRGLLRSLSERVMYIFFQNLSSVKVQIFWEGHKILRNLHLTFVLCSASQSKVEISQNFLAFSEYMNFKLTLVRRSCLIWYYPYLIRTFSRSKDYSMSFFDCRRTVIRRLLVDTGRNFNA